MTDMQTSLPLLIVRPSILNPVISLELHTYEWSNEIPYKYTFALCIPFHLLQCRCNTCTNMITNDMIHFISSRECIGSSILISLALHHSFGPSALSHHSTCPSHLQLIHQKSCLVLHLSHMTPCHVSYAMSSFITCVSLTTNSSHLHRDDTSCSHECTCGLFTCISHI
jgi:hypothetical protein